MTKRKLVRELTHKTTPQQLFDYISAFLIKQGKPSVDRSVAAGCAYRGNGGTMCAVGCIIPDNFYNPKMEGAIVPDLVRAQFNYWKPGCEEFLSCFSKFETLLDSLQESHDRDFATVGTLCTSLQKVADNFGLNFDRTLYKLL